MIPAILYSDMRHLMEEQPNGTFGLSHEVRKWMVDNSITFQEKQFECNNEVGAAINVFGLLFDDAGCMAFKLRWI